jgi:hypothetical protein
MSISIKNNTGYQLGLWEEPPPPPTLADSASVSHVFTTIDTVTLGGTVYYKKTKGSFIDGQHYVVAFVAPSTVVFTNENSKSEVIFQ